ncbi:mitochondrial import receptor subunit [Talaromyces pinophilus]|uniref:Mitochondrial import receptor subunit n=1 Tax=Talaromyces pinophilus TaxID=128442 RepID=A0A6N4SM18_TALPI|nr:mitochondrial import receptor subunit [Talaromyces pinophilus]
MVKLTEVEDEHFTTEKPIPTKEALLVSDNEDDEDFTDTESEISETDSTYEPLNETLYDRLIALKDIIPPQSRRRITATINGLSDATKTTFSFSGKALWMEREQGMMRGANEMLTPGTNAAAAALGAAGTEQPKAAL